MPEIQYVEKNFSEKTLKIIAQAKAICEEYAARGYTLSLRQAFYQFVSRDIIPNKQTEYKRLGDILGDARMAGLLDWDYLEDRGRDVTEVSHWETPSQILEAVAYQYRIEKWIGQPMRPIVLVEKDALTGVFDPVCRELDVPLFPCKGYVSLSAMWRLGQRLRGYVEDGQTPVVLHFGDHDPSGIDMTRDIGVRLNTFVGADALEEAGLDEIEVVRLALTMDQVRQFSPPPNPAKITDSRSDSYIREYGRQSWELDALDPTVLGDLVRDSVLGYRDEDLWDEKVRLENIDRGNLRRISRDYDEVTASLVSDEDDED